MGLATVLGLGLVLLPPLAGVLGSTAVPVETGRPPMDGLTQAAVRWRPTKISGSLALPSVYRAGCSQPAGFPTG